MPRGCHFKSARLSRSRPECYLPGMSLFVILLGGDLTVTPRLQGQIAGARVIAADSGMRHAAALGVTPELWLGDFDSASPDDMQSHSGVPREVWPEDKDRTDGEIAIEAALARGADRLVLAGAFGGERTDHAFLHLAAAISLGERGIPVLLTSGNEEGLPLAGNRQSPDWPDGTLFSILAFSDLSDLSVTGVRWPLANRDVPFGSSLVLSNSVQRRATVSLGKGRAMLMARIAAPA